MTDSTIVSLFLLIYSVGTTVLLISESYWEN